MPHFPPYLSERCEGLAAYGLKKCSAGLIVPVGCAHALTTLVIALTVTAVPALLSATATSRERRVTGHRQLAHRDCL